MFKEIIWCGCVKTSMWQGWLFLLERLPYCACWITVPPINKTTEILQLDFFFVLWFLEFIMGFFFWSKKEQYLLMECIPNDEEIKCYQVFVSKCSFVAIVGLCSCWPALTGYKSSVRTFCNETNYAYVDGWFSYFLFIKWWLEWWLLI